VALCPVSIGSNRRSFANRWRRCCFGDEIVFALVADGLASCSETVESEGLSKCTFLHGATIFFGAEAGSLGVGAKEGMVRVSAFAGRPGVYDSVIWPDFILIGVGVAVTM
jgi:hypothetical protein